MNDLTPSGAPNPEDGAGSSVPPEANKQDAQGEQPRPRNTGQILGEQQCLAGLSQLPGLLATGFMKPQTSNAIRGVYHELLQHGQLSGRDAAKHAVADEDVMAILRENPGMLSMLEPFLTVDQLKMILEQLNDENEKT
jgi:hypothetical protein